MGKTWKTSDGKEFTGSSDSYSNQYINELNAKSHQQDLDSEAQRAKSTSRSSKFDPVEHGFGLQVELAYRGDKEAALTVGNCYYAGLKPAKQNYKEAAKFWEMASSHGEPKGTYKLAGLYRKGLGVTQDVDKAVELYKKAADLGNNDAVNDLAEMGVQYTPKAGKTADDGKLGRLIQIGAFVIGGLFIGAVVAFVASLAFGKNSIPTESIRIIANIVGGIICFKALSPAGKTLKETRSRLLLAVLIITGGAFFMWRSNLPYPGTTLKMAKTAISKTAAQTATVTTDALNVREGPSADTALVTQLKKGDSLTVTEDTGADWVKVEAGDNSGYVHRDYITIKGTE
jgi:hypothetical protein